MRHSTTFGCPVCGEPTQVYDSQAEGTRIRRRRKCKNNHRFRTFERFDGAVKGQVEPSTTDAYDELESQLRAEKGVVSEG